MLVQDLTVAGAPDPVQKTAVQSWRTALIPSSVAFQDMPYTAQYQSSGIMYVPTSGYPISTLSANGRHYIHGLMSDAILASIFQQTIYYFYRLTGTNQN